MGSSVVQKTDIRIVAATNVNLLKAVEKGKFREDLYYRLSTVMIDVPPLHDRGEDIILLARKFAADFAEKYLTAPISFSEDAKKAMLTYRWPGNVRQLKNIIEQLALFNAGTEISRHALIELLPLDYSGKSSLVAGPREVNYSTEREMLWQLIYSMQHELQELRKKIEGGTTQDILGGLREPTQSLIKYEGPSEEEALRVTPVNEEEIEVPVTASLEEAERSVVEAALRKNKGNKKLAAEQLNISQRTLYRKIHELGIKI